MSYCCSVYAKRNDDNEFRENAKIGFQRFIKNNGLVQTFCGKDNVEKECENKIPICFESKCDNSRCKNIIVIYSNKKTGSMTLYSSLCLYFSDTTSIFHFHEKHDLLLYNVDSLTVPDLCLYLSESNKKVTVIEIYRPLLELCVSNFFFALEKYSRPKTENETINDYVHHLIHVFNNIFPFLANLCKEEKLFNDHEAKLLKQKLLFVDERDNITYILIRLKDSEHWSNILKPYLPEGDFNVHSENETENKCHGEFYNLFKKIYMLPQNYLDTIKANEGFLKYYSVEEQTEYLDHWEKKTSNEIHTPFTMEAYKEYLKNEVAPNVDDDETVCNHILNHNRSSVTNCMCDECVNEREATLSFYNNMSILFEEQDLFILE